MKERTKKISAKTLSMKVADKIRNEIIFGNYKEGERIIEQNLSEEYGVSRIPIREAIRLLESEGFLEISPYKGSIVREITPQSFKETYIMRISIVPTLLEYALPNYNSSTIKQAEELIDKTINNLSNTSFLHFVVKIQDIMYGPCKMPYLLHIAELVLKRHLMVLNIYFNSLPHNNSTLDGYRNFFEICKTKQYDKAIDYWTETVKNQYQLINTEFTRWYNSKGNPF
ncbi:GntR family transcriptional regulator [Solitalea sp. MAHUQ-68]|uniref:GntR family transcriptional regulator n=1 Tax=Solitalea agri TaxID=2953739 RepID=A0A9X2EZ81_9SPHI|nr:GntR family transcriptional regulator [Solitalea agri]MCO4291767.1 GntR family transcriptional regulator [Solitalea agri]